MTFRELLEAQPVGTCLTHHSFVVFRKTAEGWVNVRDKGLVTDVILSLMYGPFNSEFGLS